MAMDYKESIFMALVNGGKTKQIKIADKEVDFTGKVVSHSLIIDVQVNKIGLFTLLFGWHKLSVRHRVANKVEELSVLGDKSNLTRLQIEMRGAVCSYISHWLNVCENQLNSVESGYAEIYKRVNYVRFSQAKKFSDLEKDRCRVLLSSLRIMSKNPLIPLADQEKAVDLIARLSVVYHFVDNQEHARQLHNQHYANF